MTTAQKELPPGWKWVKLGDVCDVRDGTHDTPKYVESGVPLLTSKNLNQGKLDFDNVKDISFEDYLQISKRSGVDQGDVLYAMIGTIGNPVLVDTTKKFAIKNVALFKLSESPFDPEFFVYAMQSEYIKYQIDFWTKGGIQKFVSLKSLRALCFPLPPLEEQKRIAEILNKTEELKKLREEADRKTEELIPSIFHEMFGNVVFTEQTVKLGEICEFINGKTFRKNEWSDRGYPIIRIQNLNNEGAEFNYWDGSLENQIVVENGDLLLAWSGTPGTSFGAHIWEREQGVLNQHIFQVRFDKQKISRDYLQTAINQNLNHLINISHGSVGLRHVKKSQVQNMTINLPSLEDQRRFVDALNIVRDLNSHQEKCTNEIESLISALHQKAFKGEL